MLAFISAFSVSINVYATPVTEEKTEAIKQSLNEYNEIEKNQRKRDFKMDHASWILQRIWFSYFLFLSFGDFDFSALCITEV